MAVGAVVITRYYVGVDVGQVRDPAALCVLERRMVFVPGPHAGSDPASGSESWSYRIRHLERCKLGLSYPAVVDRVAAVSAKLVALEVRPGLCNSAEVIVDVTGVGRPVYDLLVDRVRGSQVTGVNFTSGQVANSGDGRVWNVPKRDLVAGLVVGFQDRELLIAEKLPEAAVLVNELVNFQMTLSAAGRDSYSNDGALAKHDDYVSAAALAYWRARKRAPGRLGQGARLFW
jgi:hypothetical protein